MPEYITKTQALEALETLRGVLGDAGTNAARRIIKGLDEGVVRCENCTYWEKDDIVDTGFCRNEFGLDRCTRKWEYCPKGTPKKKGEKDNERMDYESTGGFNP